MFSLSSTDFNSRAPNTFQQLWNEKLFTDVTLATVDDRQIEAHKSILSTNSSLFKYILSNNPHQNPLLYLGNLDYKLLNFLLEFVYLGQVNIEDTSLDGFLVAGRQLGLEGLNEEVFTIRPEQTDTCPEEQKTEDSILREPPEAETDLITRKKQNNTIEEIKCEMCDNDFKTVSDFNSHMLSCRMSQNLSEIGPELIASRPITRVKTVNIQVCLKLH